jgi:hypothetical protein
LNMKRDMPFELVPNKYDVAGAGYGKSRRPTR